MVDENGVGLQIVSEIQGAATYVVKSEMASTYGMVSTGYVNNANRAQYNTWTQHWASDLDDIITNLQIVENVTPSAPKGAP